MSLMAQIGRYPRIVPFLRLATINRLGCKHFEGRSMGKSGMRYYSNENTGLLLHHRSLVNSSHTALPVFSKFSRSQVVQSIAIGGSDGKVQPNAIGGGDGKVQPSTIGGSDDEVQPSAIGGGDDEVQPGAIGGSNGEVQPSSTGGSNGEVQPSSTGGSNGEVGGGNGAINCSSHNSGLGTDLPTALFCQQFKTLGFLIMLTVSPSFVWKIYISYLIGMLQLKGNGKLMNSSNIMPPSIMDYMKILMVRGSSSMGYKEIRLTSLETIIGPIITSLGMIMGTIIDRFLIPDKALGCLLLYLVICSIINGLVGSANVFHVPGKALQWLSQFMNLKKH